MTAVVEPELEVILASDEEIEYRIYLDGQVTEKRVRKIIDELYWLDTTHPTAQIEFIINSEGGSLIDGDALYSELYSLSLRGGGSHFITTKIRGTACSVASLIFEAGDERVAGKMDYLGLHEPLQSMPNQTYLSTIESYAVILRKWRDNYVDVLMARATVPRSEIEKLVGPKDVVLHGDEALELGLIDRLG